MNGGTGAGEAIAAAASAALAGVPELNQVREGRPVRASVPYATIDAGLETDWGHKSGAGREVRLSVTLRDEGEGPERIRRLSGQAEAALGEIAAELGGWRLVTLVLLRSRLARGADGWTAALDWRARMLAQS